MTAVYVHMKITILFLVEKQFSSDSSINMLTVAKTYPMIFSSRVFLVMSRYTFTTLVCPILCARSIA